MSEIKRFIDIQVPINLCNFRCEYCYLSGTDRITEKPEELKYEIGYIAKALSPKRFGGICNFNLCGTGETLLYPPIIELTEALLEMGHYISIVTNGVLKKPLFDLYSFPAELLERVFIKFSFHYTELLRLGLLDVYLNNVAAAKAAGVSFTVELVASEGNIPHIDDIKAVCLKSFGALCHITDPRSDTLPGIPRLTAMKLERHQELWAQFESALFDYKQETWGINRKDKFCYAGEWTFALELGSGLLKQCYCGGIQNIFEDINEPIHFFATGNECPFAHCFNSHVWDCLCGVIPSIKSPSYAELRNRVCADGSEWLQPKIKKAYSEKISENHNEYDKEKKVFTNGILALAYREYEPDDSFIGITERYLYNKGYKRVIIYGSNKTAAWLRQHLNNIDIVDMEEKAGSCADAIIVTEHRRFTDIKRQLSDDGNTPVVNILDIAKAAIEDEK